MAAVAPSTSRSRHDGMTIQDVIDLVIDGMPTGAMPPDTVDTVKVGDAQREVAGVVTTFLATSAIVRSAADLNANLIISHETLFYNHRDETDWLEDDAVYASKRSLLEDTGMVVWRLHDRLHRIVPDGITTGVLEQLGWEAYASTDNVNICTIPSTTLGELARFLKQTLEADAIRFVGDPAMPCEKIGVLMGAWDSRKQMEYLRPPGVDVLLCGEAREWETTEYVRDANEAGIKKGVVVCGHALSEEPGMAWFTTWLRDRVPGVNVVHIPTGDPFHYV